MQMLLFGVIVFIPPYCLVTYGALLACSLLVILVGSRVLKLKEDETKSTGKTLIPFAIASWGINCASFVTAGVVATIVSYALPYFKDLASEFNGNLPNIEYVWFAYLVIWGFAFLVFALICNFLFFRVWILNRRKRNYLLLIQVLLPFVVFMIFSYLAYLA